MVADCRIVPSPDTVPGASAKNDLQHCCLKSTIPNKAYDGQEALQEQKVWSSHVTIELQGFSSRREVQQVTLVLGNDEY